MTTRDGSEGVVSVIDYGIGNLGSVMNMLRRIGVAASVVRTPEELASGARLLLPGVGAFDRGMDGLRSRGLDGALVDAVKDGKPILGICLGMQLLARSSEEGTSRGLGLLDADCVKIEFGDTDLRVPQMGWNWVDPLVAHGLFPPAEARRKFYFAHSYHVVCDSPDAVIATTKYGATLNAVVGVGNVLGAQFHPEKSHVFGMNFLSAFSKWAP